MSTKTTKGNKVQLSTFLKWNVSDVVGYTTNEENGNTYVVTVYCKVCARNKEAALKSCKGPIKEAVMRFIDGTNFVTNHSVTKHLSKAAHMDACKAENEKPVGERIVTSTTGESSKRSKVNCIFKVQHRYCIDICNTCKSPIVYSITESPDRLN